MAGGAYIANNIKNTIKSQHTGHCRLATCPSQFTSAAALPAGKWQQPLLFLCFAVSLACTTCAALHTSLSPPPLSLLWHWREQRRGKPCRCHRRTQHLCTHSAGGRGWHQPSPAAASASLQLAIRFLPRSRGHLPHPRGCHLLKQIITIENLIYRA